ncbi:NAD-dependent epimerase/dehydratase family protein [Actinomadura alba]|uniref:NAD(P)-dependent oxidoreductase n=1 Tax=Actinomadura alba TaxID=406431 RepID=A0ABR7LRB2_9ACTN|nr:NAD(P)-dependent oxidoreductase [Actinomadura alba]MBC6467291.1 NAD(P)-dependent oxidoreductase [Actinomadura alba]
MRLLLIGASGFIGRHIRARATGFQVVTISRSQGAGDVCLDLAAAGPAEVAKLIDEEAPDAVVNCSGVTGGDPAEMVSGNVVAVANLVAALAAVPVRLVHVGSAAEYGQVAPGNPITESTEPRPVGPYGVTKLAGTEIVRAAVSDAVVLRVFNPIGPGMPGSTLPGRVAARLRGRDAEVRVGSLAAHRDFVDVRDVADAVLAAAGCAGPLPPVLNVGSGRATPLREVVTALSEIAGPGSRIVEDTAGGSARSAGVPWQQADISAIGRALGWAPTTDLTASLRDLWKDTACLA